MYSDRHISNVYIVDMHLYLDVGVTHEEAANGTGFPMFAHDDRIPKQIDRAKKLEDLLDGLSDVFLQNVRDEGDQGTTEALVDLRGEDKVRIADVRAGLHDGQDATDQLAVGLLLLFSTPPLVPYVYHQHYTTHVQRPEVNLSRPVAAASDDLSECAVNRT